MNQDSSRSHSVFTITIEAADAAAVAAGGASGGSGGSGIRVGCSGTLLREAMQRTRCIAAARVQHRCCCRCLKPHFTPTPCFAGFLSTRQPSPPSGPKLQ